jgi:hypothetical protein
LLLRGRQDRFLPFGYGEWLAGQIPEVTARLLQDDRHLAYRTGEDHSRLAEHLETTTWRCEATTATDMMVVFDAGQNSGDNFAHLAGTAACTTSGRSRPRTAESDGPARSPDRRLGSVRRDDRLHATSREIYGARRRTILIRLPKPYAPRRSRSRTARLDILAPGPEPVMSARLGDQHPYAAHAGEAPTGQVAQVQHGDATF